MEILKKAKLICVTDANNNKFYNMEAQPDNTFLVTYGRVEGGKFSTVVYPMSKWDSTIKSKLKKGYTDVTHLYATEDTKITYVEITEKSINDIINRLMKFSKKVVETNYSISSNNVTKKMLEEAQSVLDDISNMSNKFNHTSNSASLRSDINTQLLKLFKILPRKMSKVQIYLIPEDIDKLNKNEALSIINKIITSEQDILDSLSATVSINSVNSNTTKEQKINILDKLGIEIKEKDSDLENKVINMLGELKDKYVNCWYVVNKKTQKKYNVHLDKATNKKEEKFWHGSRNENWLSILENGLIIRPSNAVYTGSMLSDGIYFADKALKSFGYCSSPNSYWTRGNSNTSIIALYNVHVGNQYHVKMQSNENYKFSLEYLKKKGDYDSVYAHATNNFLKNNEYVIYSSEQCTIFSLIELKK